MEDTKVEKITRTQELFGKIFEEIKTYQELNSDAARILKDVLRPTVEETATVKADGGKEDTELLNVLKDVYEKLKSCNVKLFKLLERVEL